MTTKLKRTRKRQRRQPLRAARGYDSALGCARGELMLVEYAAKKAAKELREIADRIERIASCAKEAYERINPNKES